MTQSESENYQEAIRSIADAYRTKKDADLSVRGIGASEDYVLYVSTRFTLARDGSSQELAELLRFSGAKDEVFRLIKGKLEAKFK